MYVCIRRLPDEPSPSHILYLPVLYAGMQNNTRRTSLQYEPRRW